MSGLKVKNLTLFGGVCVLALVAVAGAQDYKSVPPEKAVGGLTTEERLAEMARLHGMVTSEMPEGTLSKRIGVKLSADEIGELQRVVPRAGEPLKIGLVKPLPVALSVNGISPTNKNARAAGGSFANLDDGGFSWAITVGSEGARAIRVHIRNFSLPENAEMYIFNMKGEAHGPYTGRGPLGTGEFWTNSVRSDTGVIMVRQVGPTSDLQRARITFIIDKVGHIGGTPGADPRNHTWNDPDKCAEFGSNPPCVEDAECGSVAPADQSAIAKMEWISGCCIFTCTGGLIADTDTGSQRNLFLTANHCLSRQRLADRLEFWFEYTTDSCQGNCPHNPPDITNGATLLDSSTNGDHTLLELNSNPPAGSTFLGWNNTPIANSNGAALARVSNPNYGSQVFSTHVVDTSRGTCQGLPRGEFIYSSTTFGGTDGGSSGSPVVNAAGEIVGQLFGACGFNVGDPCDDEANATVDGALAHYFPDVEQYLDPSGGGCTSDAECDDGDACNGAETCVGGSCQAGTPPPCQNGDGCCPDGCDSGNDDDCAAGGCVNPGGLPPGASCVDDIECCSDKCKGRSGSKTCK